MLITINIINKNSFKIKWSGSNVSNQSWFVTDSEVELVGAVQERKELEMFVHELSTKNTKNSIEQLFNIQLNTLQDQATGNHYI